MEVNLRAAEVLAAAKLAEALPRRWVHVQAVAAKAARISSSVPDPDLLVAAAWLHDIGYAPDVTDTGLHGLDGARWLIRQGWDPRLAGLVANHSCALYEAEERGLADDLGGEFPRERSAEADALWFADMTTGPDGQDLTVQERLREIRARYGPQDVVTKFWRRAEPSLLRAVGRTQARLELSNASVGCMPTLGKRCPARVELSDRQFNWLDSRPDAAHMVERDYECDLETGHDEPHAAMGQQGDNVEWWVRWTLSASEVQEVHICPDIEPGSDPENENVCLLFDGHPGRHSFDLEPRYA